MKTERTDRTDRADQKTERERRFWDERRGTVRSRKGGWKLGKDVTIHGHSLINELIGSASWFQVWLLSITGRLPERRFADWCEGVWLCLSYPDPRIWCNQVSALAGTLRCTPVAATSAAAMTSDALRYASWAALHTAEFIRDALKRRNESARSIEELLASQRSDEKGCPQVPGYSRPIAVGDERLSALMRLVHQHGFSVGPHLSLGFEIHAYLKEKHHEQMNAGGFISAFLLDQGMSPQEIYRFYSMGAQAGAIACYVDTFEREGESFMPMRCDDFEYRGAPRRELPKKR
jgi:citrate synthase